MNEETIQRSASVRFFEALMRPLFKLRGKTVGRAHGVVLEIGVGSGLNFSLYEGFERLYGIEPDLELLTIARQRAEQASLPIELYQVGAEALPFSDEMFDSIVVTWVFCTIPALESAIEEIHRVLKPDGQLYYIEHTRSPHAVMKGLQRFVNPLWKKIAGGCHLTRDPKALLEEKGFVHLDFRAVNTHPLNPFPMYAGVAQKSHASGGAFACDSA